MALSHKKITVILMIFLLSVTLFGCTTNEVNESNESSLLINIITLEFLPSGMEVIKGESISADSNIRTSIIPIIGFLINIFIMLLINIIDFIIWPFSWIPGLSNLISFIGGSHDIDQTSSIFTHHRNFLSHSVLNPIILIYSWISYKFRKVSILNFILILPLIAFAAGILADTMPRGWGFYSYIHISLLGFRIFSLSAFFTRLWLFLNSFILISLTAGFITDEK